MKYISGKLFLLLLFLQSITSVFSLPDTIILDKDLEIRELTDEIYVVIHKFPWAGNSLLVFIGKDDLVFVDTPCTPEATDMVLDWVEKRFGEKKIIEINTGYHVDNLGGNQALSDRGIPVYGSEKTVQLLEEKGEEMRKLILSGLEDPSNKKYHDDHASVPYIPPDHLFSLDKGLTLSIGNEKVKVIFPGETHAPDNVAVYFPGRKLLFGGCMIRAGKQLGNTADANLETWKASVMNLRDLDCIYVIPGHGYRFDPGLIENTINIFP